MKAMASRILHPFFGNFKSLARASSEIIGRPEAIKNGKNDQHTPKAMAMYWDIWSITFFPEKTSSAIFCWSCMISVLKRRVTITMGAKYQLQCLKVFKEKNLYFISCLGLDNKDQTVYNSIVTYKLVEAGVRMTMILETQDIHVNPSFSGRRWGIGKTLLLRPTLMSHVPHIPLKCLSVGLKMLDILYIRLRLLSCLPCQYLPFSLIYSSIKPVFPQILSD